MTPGVLTSLDSTVGIVAGGTSGTGAGIATTLADAGATIAIADRDLASAQGQAKMVHEGAHSMIEAHEGGRTVNLASSASQSMVVKGMSAYAGFKGTLLALKVEHGITVNTVLA